MPGENNLEQEINELVIARLNTLPDDTEISIGGEGDFNKHQLIEHVKAEDEIGKQIVEIEMDFLRAFKDGKLYESLYSGNSSEI